MQIPNLNRIIDTGVPVAQDKNYVEQFRREIVVPIRQLQSVGLIRWYSVLLHPGSLLESRAANPNDAYFHIRLEPRLDLSIEDCIRQLPLLFRHLAQLSKPLNDIEGVKNDFLQERNWAHAWRMVGEATEFIFALIESHGDAIPPEQVFQFVHYITNPLGLGMSSFYVPNGQTWVRF